MAVSDPEKTPSRWRQPVACSADGKIVVVLCGGKTIQFLETETGKVMGEIRFFREVRVWD